MKEYYFYLDATPTHSYMKYLYKYPQKAFPYDELVGVNRQRDRTDPEYELIDTGVFDGDRYFDVFVEYAKAAPDDILIKISASNRGPDAAPLHMLPTFWFRNTWTGWPDQPKPSLREANGGVIVASSGLNLHCDGHPSLHFTENETNNQRLFGTANASPYAKDGINDLVVLGKQQAVNPSRTGTKAAAHYPATINAV